MARNVIIIDCGINYVTLNNNSARAAFQHVNGEIIVASLTRLRIIIPRPASHAADNRHYAVLLHQIV